MDYLYQGCLPDVRPIEEKEKDFKAEELVAFGGIDWKEKKFEDVRTFPVRNQDGSGSCVAQTLALILGIENFLEEGRFIEFSAKDIYTRRSNSGMGMIGVEALDIARKYGATLESFIPSQNLGESEMNKIERKISDTEVAEIFKIKNFAQVEFDIEKIAFIIEGGRKDGVGKPLMTWFQFPRAEWDSKPDLTNSTTDMVHHSVTCIDYGMMNGKRGIFIQDSWGLHSSTYKGLRFITEDYIKSRMTFCAYILNLENNWQDTVTPTEIITKTLYFGMTDPEVVILQNMLKNKGFFPTNVSSTGFFGAVTKKSVIAFQKANGLLQDGIVGDTTRSVLNKNY